MSNDAKRTSELTITTTLSSNDRVVVVTNTAGSLKTQTITAQNLGVSLTQNNIPIANSSQLGIIKIGNTLSIAANGVVDIPISSFGEGFSLTSSDKIVTNKLYSTNESNTAQHYRLTLGTNGVVNLPDESVIDGATLKTVPGDGYAGLAAGPNSEHSEDSWMWVDSGGAWIGTDYSNNGFTWQFNNSGEATLPIVIAGDSSIGTPFHTNPPGHTLTLKHNGGVSNSSGGELKFNYGTAEIKVIKDAGATRTWTFSSDGTLNLPDSVSTGNAIIQTTSAINIQVNSNSQVWTFGTDGSLTIPANSTVKSASGDLSLYSTGNVNIESKGHTFIFDTDTVGRFIMPPSGVIASSDSGDGLHIFTGNVASETGNTWTFGTDGSFTVPGPIYGGSKTIGIATPAPLNLNNTGSVGEVKTQLNLINTAGNAGTGSAIDYFTYVDQGNGLPGARLQAVDDNAYSANFSIALKGKGNTGNNGLTTVWTFGSDGRTTFPSPSAPVHSYGVDGDKAGMISFDASYIYYCTADYVDDVTDIWKRIAWPGDTW